jgi:hypothetical protein
MIQRYRKIHAVGRFFCIVTYGICNNTAKSYATSSRVKCFQLLKQDSNTLTRFKCVSIATVLFTKAAY